MYTLKKKKKKKKKTPYFAKDIYIYMKMFYTISGVQQVAKTKTKTNKKTTLKMSLFFLLF